MSDVYVPATDILVSFPIQAVDILADLLNFSDIELQIQLMGLLLTFCQGAAMWKRSGRMVINNQCQLS